MFKGIRTNKWPLIKVQRKWKLIEDIGLDKCQENFTKGLEGKEGSFLYLLYYSHCRREIISSAR